ncbi:hypothetical protein [Arthrobacter sp. H5]|uniref:hypothetical protein n=1 Tax=Arthrobacter sp. H5 TaxID=1267973 RepID=UPI0004848097|nr:hypothetical protein [Arthrobacter sp. H5]
MDSVNGGKRGAESGSGEPSCLSNVFINLPVSSLERSKEFYALIDEQIADTSVTSSATNAVSVDSPKNFSSTNR